MGCLYRLLHSLFALLVFAILTGIAILEVLFPFSFLRIWLVYLGLMIREFVGVGLDIL